MAKHGNRGKGGNVASMAIESHGSGNRVGKTKVLGRSCLVYRLFWGCLLYSLLGSEEENGGIMGGGVPCMCTLAAPGIRSKKESYEEAIRGLAAEQLQSTYLSLPLLPTLPNVSRKELLPFLHISSSSSICPVVNSSKQFISRVA